MEFNTLNRMMAARYTGPTEGAYQINPRHMAVNKPLNIDDYDLSDDICPIEKPMSQPTQTSYLLQRLRMAELAREMVDRQPISKSTTNGPSYAEILIIDTEFEKFLCSIPPFFKMGSDNIGHSHTGSRSDLKLQSYILHSILHTQRCKLHLPYLTGRSAQPMSQEICLKTAKKIVEIEMRLDTEAHPFASSRLKFACTLYGLFMASIVLLMDTCANESARQDLDHSDFADAFRILQNAKLQSLATTKILELVMRVLRRHRISPPNTGSLPAANVDEQDLNTHMPDSIEKSYSDDTAIEMANELPNLNDSSANFDELMQGLELPNDVDETQWNGVFTELDSFLLNLL